MNELRNHIKIMVLNYEKVRGHMPSHIDLGPGLYEMLDYDDPLPEDGALTKLDGILVVKCFLFADHAIMLREHTTDTTHWGAWHCPCERKNGRD